MKMGRNKKNWHTSDLKKRKIGNWDPVNRITGFSGEQGFVRIFGISVSRAFPISEFYDFSVFRGFFESPVFSYFNEFTFFPDFLV